MIDWNRDLAPLLLALKELNGQWSADDRRMQTIKYFADARLYSGSPKFYPSLLRL
jgi:hypothetical protein